MQSVRSCSFVLDWWVGTIPNRIVSLIYINFDYLEQFQVQSDTNEQGLKELLVVGIMEENNTISSFFLRVDCCYNLPVKQFGLSYDSLPFSHVS
jgi:hypothetical protein